MDLAADLCLITTENQALLHNLEIVQLEDYKHDRSQSSKSAGLEKSSSASPNSSI